MRAARAALVDHERGGSASPLARGGFSVAKEPAASAAPLNARNVAIERATTMLVVMWRFMVSSLVVVFMARRIVGAANVAPTRGQHGQHLTGCPLGRPACEAVR
jgi:hypothetical protein